jgi:hypothetical protein
MTSDYWTFHLRNGYWQTPNQTDQPLRTVSFDKTGTRKTVSLRTYTYPYDCTDWFKIARKEGDIRGRDIISKTTFGENSRLRALGVDSIEFAKKSKDMVINMVNGKKMDAGLRLSSERDMVKNFFNLLKRLK